MLAVTLNMASLDRFLTLCGHFLPPWPEVTEGGLLPAELPSFNAGGTSGLRGVLFCLKF